MNYCPDIRPYTSLRRAKTLRTTIRKPRFPLTQLRLQRRNATTNIENVLRTTKSTARPCPAAQLWLDSLYSIHDVEGLVSHRRLPVSNCCRSLGINGTTISKGRPPLSMESKYLRRDKGWRDCGIQCSGQRYSNCSPGCQEVRRRVSPSSQIAPCDIPDKIALGRTQSF